MRLADLITAAEQSLKPIEQELAFELLAENERAADVQRYAAFEALAVANYIAPGDEIEFHRSLLPKDEHWYGATAPSQTFYWKDWNRLTVHRIGPDCVRVFLPGRGSYPMPVGDFVRAVVLGHIREPVNTAR